MQDRQGSITIITVGPIRHLQLELNAASFSQPRRVTWTFDGRPAGAFTVPAAGSRHISLDLGQVAPGNHTVALTPAPQGDRIDAVLGNGDQRIVSLDVGDSLQVVRVKP